MTQELATVADAKIVKLAEERVESLMENITAYLEPIGIDSKFFGQCTVTALATNSHLMDADRGSFKSALLKCAQRGLLPDGESAVLVPFKGNVTLIPMIGGLLDMVRRNCPGIAIQSRVVMRWDEFSVVHGTQAELRHVPHPIPANLDLKALDDPANIDGAWCIVTMPPQVRGAEPVMEVHHMFAAEIEKVRSRVYGSRTPKSPWTIYTRRMYEKTAIRACLKRLPSRHQIFAHFDESSLDDFTHRTVEAVEAPVAAIMPPKAIKI